MSNMQKIYISGPITGVDPEVCRAHFERAENELRAQGYTPINPLKNGLPHTAPWEEHMRRDLALMDGCEAVYMLEGWEHSRGCKIEFNMAITARKPIAFEAENK